MALQSYVPAMSQRHKDEFERIKREHDTVVLLLLDKKVLRHGSTQVSKTKNSGVFNFDPLLLESAVVNASDAYSLLLIAVSEGYMRSFLDSVGVKHGNEPKLSNLINQCRKEYNSRKFGIPISLKASSDLHLLRQQRNTYAHGYGSSVFPPIDSIVAILGRFFDRLP